MPGDKDYVIKYGTDFSDVRRGIQNVETINQRMAQTLGNNFQKAVSVVGQTVDKFSQSTELQKTANGFQEVNTAVLQTGTVVKTAGGQFREYVETTKIVNGEVKKVEGSFKDVTGQFTKTNIETQKSKKNFLTLGENLKRLASRAVLTIPVWFALRGAINGVFRTISNGLKGIVDFDRALQKAKRNLQGSTAEIESNFKTLRVEVEKLSLESGESVDKITKAFQRFATTGLDFETSLAGAIGATKLAVTLFGDTEEIANQVARAFRVLGDASGENGTQAEQLTRLYAQLDELWQTNAFELREFGQAFEQFAPTARTANLNIQETVSLLATLQTAGVRGSRAGRLLRTSIQKLVLNLDKLAPTLGIKVNPQLDTTFGLLLKVLDAIEKLNNASQLAPEATEAIAELFGGIRGAEPVKALIALRQELEKNLQVTGDIEKFNNTYNNVTTTIAKQVDIFKNLNQEIARALVTGIVGGDDFLDSLVKINEALQSLQNQAERGGRLLRNLFSVDIAGIRGLRGFIEEEIGASIKKGFENADEEGRKFIDKLNKGLRGELSKIDLTDIIKNLRVELNKNNIEITDQAIISLEGSLRRALEDKPIPLNFKVEQRELEEQFVKNIQDISKTVLDIELDILKTRGATSAELLKAETELSKQFGIEEDTLDVVRRRLELEKAVNEEKRLQSRLGSDSVKLFRIARDEGADIARQIGDVLAGEVDFDNFIRRGGEAVDIFKKQFSDLFEQQQALAFFQGDVVPGLTGLRGGTRIPIEEEAIRQPFSRAEASIELRKAIEQFKTLQAPSEVKDMTVNRLFIANLEGATNLLTNADINQQENIARIAQRALPATSFTRTQSEIVFKVEFPGTAPIVFEGNRNDFVKFLGNQLGEQIVTEAKTKGTPLNDAINQNIEEF